MKGITKAEVISELIAVGQSRITDPAEAKKALRENWEVVPTPINKNMVFFHAFGDFADDIVPIIGLSPGGIDMKLPDDLPINIAFMFLAPEYLGEIYRRMIESLSRIFSHIEHFEWLLRCKTADEIIAFISYLEAKNKIMKMLDIEDIKDVNI